MIISKLIEELEKQKEKHGDVVVYMQTRDECLEPIIDFEPIKAGEWYVDKDGIIVAYVPNLAGTGVDR